VHSQCAQTEHTKSSKASDNGGLPTSFTLLLRKENANAEAEKLRELPVQRDGADLDNPIDRSVVDHPSLINPVPNPGGKNVSNVGTSYPLASCASKASFTFRLNAIRVRFNGAGFIGSK
jgi:hypothetical protein